MTGDPMTPAVASLLSLGFSISAHGGGVRVELVEETEGGVRHIVGFRVMRKVGGGHAGNWMLVGRDDDAMEAAKVFLEAATR